MQRVKNRIEEFLSVLGLQYNIKVHVEPRCETIAYIEGIGLGICRFGFGGKIYHQVVVVCTVDGLSYPKSGMIYMDEKTLFLDVAVKNLMMAVVELKLNNFLDKENENTFYSLTSGG